MPSRSSIPALALAGLMSLTASAPAWAVVLANPQWQAWFEGGRSDELERAATERLAAQPEDAQAATALALSKLDRSDPREVTAGEQAAEACIARQPGQASCYFALGAIQGRQAWSGGGMKAIGLAGRIQNNLSRALRLDPLMYEARLSLLQVYMLAPGMLGGSMAKARSLAEEAEARQPEHAKLLRALIAGHDKLWPAMEKELRSVKPGDDASLTAQWRDAWGEYGYATMKSDQLVKAREVFEKIRTDWPRQALGPYGLGRVSAQAGKFDDAVQFYQRAAALEGAAKLQIDHRLGLALQSRGDKDEARRVLERFVASGRANPKNLEDARKRLAEMAREAG